MQIPPVAHALASKLTNGSKPRWYATSPHILLYVGFTFDPTTAPLEVTPLTADTTFTLSYIADYYRPVWWPQVRITHGYTYLKWTDPRTSLHMEFACGVGVAGDERAVKATSGRLNDWRTNWCALLDTKMPIHVMRAAVQEAGGRFAAVAITIAAQLLHQAGSTAAFKEKVDELWALGSDSDCDRNRIRRELTQYIMGKYRDCDLRTIMRGVKAVAAQLNND